MKATIYKFERSETHEKDTQGNDIIKPMAIITLISEMPENLPIGKEVEISA